MGNVKTDFNVAPFFVDAIEITPGLGFSDREAPSGFIGGGQIGSIGSIPPSSSWALRPTYKALSKETPLII
jgi:hypothetical protein